MRPYSLASWLVSNDVDLKTVSSTLRHRNPNTTLGIYSHAVDSKKANASGTVPEHVAGERLRAIAEWETARGKNKDALSV
jgi:integrase